MSSKSRRISFLISANAQQFFRELNKSQKELQKFGRDVKKVGDNINRNFTAPMAVLGLASVKMASDFETSMNKIQNLVGLSADQVDGMKKSVLDLSNESGKSAKDLSEALFTITSAGARGAEALEILEQSAKGSAIGLGDTQSIARTTTAVLQAYGKENISAEKASNIFFNTVREGNLDAEQLAGAISNVIPLASQLGVGFDQIGANIATLTRLGASADESATSLRGLLSAIINPTDQAREALQEVELSFEDLQASIQEKGLAKTLVDLIQRFDGNTTALAQVVPNVRALTNVLGVAGSQGEDYIKISDNITKSTDTVSEAFDNIADQTSHKFNKSLESLKNQGIEIGTLMLPIVNDLLDHFQDLIRYVSSLETETKQFAIQVTALVGALGILLSIAGKIAIVFGAISIKVVALIAVIAGIIVVGQNMIDNWDYFASTFNAMWDGLVVAFRKGVQLIASGLNRIGLLSDENLTKLEKKTAEAESSFIDSMVAMHESSNNVTSLGESFSNLGTNIRSATSGLFDFITTSAGLSGLKAPSAPDSSDGESAPNIKPTVDPTFIGNDGVDAFSRIRKASDDLVLSMDEILEKGRSVQENFKKTKDQGIDLSSALQSTITQGIVSFSETLGDVFSGDAGAKSFFDSILLLVADFANQLGKMIVGIGVASLSLQSVFANPYGAIVAGGTLIALSQMAKNLMQSGINDSGGTQPAQLATGGIIPSGFPNDTFPAMLSSGETVLPPTKPLPDIVNQGGSGTHSGFNYNAMRRAFSQALNSAELKASGKDLKLVINDSQSGRLR